ncbi:S66 family peptidase [Pontibacillus marinus]|uniref:Peptidase S66 n=1 Tax=Pontibacillus marinus BH030004 = DSM 16465 TaxID=1385511 RepID=A0A0A5FUJ8_9BACI|nr:S66 peptidase family protein [Pontibacillus marinus]KGX84446.1 peptidase S66 [Pontibacillus marinus BH030004 = DSM 16465]
MIKYPKPLQEGDTIAVTAPSSGVEEELHWLLHQAKKHAEEMSFNIVIGDTVWTERKARSTSKEERAEELMNFLLDDQVDVVMPPWGGEFLMQLLPLLNWDKLKHARPKWILGFSDISTLTFAFTLHTGIATAHGTNFFDLSLKKMDALTSRWREVLGLEDGEALTQRSSHLYQSSWEKVFENPGEQFVLDTPTEWKTTGGHSVSFEGRLIGGCANTLNIIAGTKHAPFELFQSQVEEGLVWYLEWVEWSASDALRALWKFKELGWFENTNGVLIGRPIGGGNTKDFTYEEAIHEVFEEVNIPVIYDVDIGHMPPQMTLINGAFTEVEAAEGKGSVTIKRV